MNYCKKCNRMIRKKDINTAFQITLGDLENGKFFGGKMMYFHRKCICDVNSCN